MATLGQVDELWGHEAAEFTPWLAKNLRVLGDVLGINLDLQDTESAVGEFSLDILARGNRGLVAIENQLGRSDHRHLGQLLTYTVGRDACDAVWIASMFREPHIDALEMLNQWSTDGVDFYAVEVLAVRGSDMSPPLPRFRPVVVPDSWSGTRDQELDRLVQAERAKTNAAPNPIRELREKLVDPAIADLRSTEFADHKPGQTLENERGFLVCQSEPSVEYRLGLWKDRSMGLVVQAYVWFHSREKELNKSRFDLLQQRRSEIDDQLGNAVYWDRRGDETPATMGLKYRRPAEVSDEWLHAAQEWCVKGMSRLRAVVDSHLKEILNC